MNFSPIKTKERYEYTKEMVKFFDGQIESLKKQYKQTSDFVIFAESVYCAKHIMEAEVQDYENKKNGRLLNEKFSISGKSE